MKLIPCPLKIFVKESTFVIDTQSRQKEEIR